MDLEIVRKVFDEKINPGLAQHKGGSEVISYEDGILTIKLLGACSSCMMTDETINNFILETVQADFPEVKKIELDDPFDQETYDFVKKLLNHQL